MSVKCLTVAQKDALVFGYSHNRVSLQDLSKLYGVSSRTIGRVLEERGLATPVPRVKGEAYLALQACKQHGIDPHNLGDYLAWTHLLQEGTASASKEAVVTFLATCDYRTLRDLLLGISARITADLRLPEDTRQASMQLQAAAQEGAVDGRSAATA
jgi:hypothetical protein